MAFETDNWEFIPARWFVPGRPKAVRLIVIHTTESHEAEGSARGVANDFKTRGPDHKGSSTIVVDDKEIIQCVKDSNTPAAAPGANQDGIHIELCGMAEQTSDNWTDPFSQAELALAADAAAQYCLKYDIPVVHLTNSQLQAGDKGIVGHVQVSEVYKKSDHFDPGPNFPWASFIAQVQANFDQRSQSAEAAPA
jgi:hypothetical protein